MNERLPPDPTWARARRIVLTHGWNAVSYQVLHADVTRWLDPEVDAVVGYGACARTRVVVGAPVCATSALASVVERFEADAAVTRERVVYLCAGTRLEAVVHDAHTRLTIGALPVWLPADWSATVATTPSLRAQLRRATNKGVVVHRHAASETTPAIRDALRARLTPIVTAWLATRGLPPLHFMTSADLLGALEDREVFVAELDGVAIAFAVCSPIPLRDGWLVEAWPRDPAAPNGTTHLLIDAILRAAATDGRTLVTLGLAPLSERAAAVANTPRWLDWSLRWMRVHGSRFYNFRGLEAFKASLRPAAWEPMYAIVRGDAFTPGVLRAVAGVFGGGSPERFLLRALHHAARAEIGRPAFRSRTVRAMF